MVNTKWSPHKFVLDLKYLFYILMFWDLSFRNFQIISDGDTSYTKFIVLDKI